MNLSGPPKNKQEFKEYLEYCQVKYPERWLREEYTEALFLTFLVANGMWAGLQNPSKEKPLSKEVNYYRRIQAKNPGTSKDIPKEYRLLEKFLEQGVDELELAYTIRHFELSVAYQLLRIIDLNYFDGIDNLSLGVFKVNEDHEPVGKPITGMAAEFMSAIPKSQSDSDVYV